MTRMNHERFRRRKVYEPDVPVEFQDQPQGPTKADLRAQAARAMAEYRKPVSKALAPSRPRTEPPVVTPASTVPQDLTIECQCGHKATIHRAPADLIGRRLRCSQCGEEPLPF
jgi:hypothetical protein